MDNAAGIKLPACKNATTATTVSKFVLSADSEIEDIPTTLDDPNVSLLACFRQQLLPLSEGSRVGQKGSHPCPEDWQSPDHHDQAH